MLPLKVESVKFQVPLEVLMAPPGPLLMVLPLMVQLSKVQLPLLLLMAPPDRPASALFPLRVMLVRVQEPLLLFRAPPDPASFPVMVQSLRITVLLEVEMAPPPPPVSPFCRVMSVSSSVAELLVTSKMRSVPLPSIIVEPSPAPLMVTVWLTSRSPVAAAFSPDPVLVRA